MARELAESEQRGRIIVAENHGEAAMNIETALTSFNEQLVVPLFADVTRTLEVTCHIPGPKNHGSNFAGNGAVLSAIETVAQFTDPTRESERQSFVSEAKARYASLDGNVKKYVTPRYSPIDGSRLAQNFMRDYFGEPIAQGKALEVPLRELVWAFRNPHLHAFYPYYQKQFNNRLIAGAVDWMYLDFAKRVGITIEQLEKDFEMHKHMLYTIEGDRIRICPQILFVYFKRAVSAFVDAIQGGGDVQGGFLETYRRLAASYGFQL
jgi:hypothetical protein